MTTLSRSPKVPVAIPPMQLEELWREPLAVLVMGTDILRQYGGRMSAALREEQRLQMRAAAVRLAASLRGA